MEKLYEVYQYYEDKSDGRDWGTFVSLIKNQGPSLMLSRRSIKSAKVHTASPYWGIGEYAPYKEPMLTDFRLQFIYN